MIISIWKNSLLNKIINSFLYLQDKSYYQQN